MGQVPKWRPGTLDKYQDGDQAPFQNDEIKDDSHSRSMFAPTHSPRAKNSEFLCADMEMWQWAIVIVCAQLFWQFLSQATLMVVNF